MSAPLSVTVCYRLQAFYDSAWNYWDDGLEYASASPTAFAKTRDYIAKNHPDMPVRIVKVVLTETVHETVKS